MSDDGRTLLEVLRAERGVRSASRGCEDGTCGACRVIVAGRLVAACRVKWRDVPAEARGRIEPYESLADDPAARAAVDAFAAERPTRCKLCVGALGVTAAWLARTGGAGDPEAVERALTDATCMCTGRGSWRRALLRR